MLISIDLECVRACVLLVAEHAREGDFDARQ